MPASPCAVEVVTDAQALIGLQPEWDELYARAGAPYLSQSFAWCRCAWETMARPRGARLFCIVVRREGRLALVWPLVVIRRRRFWRAVTALGGVEDYADLLIEEAPDRADLVTIAWQALRDHCRADLVHLARVRVDTPLYEVLIRAGGRAIEVQQAPCLTWDGHGDWQSYWLSRSRKFRSDLDRRQRRLGDAGAVSFEMAAGERCSEAVRWMFRRKEEWRTRKGIGHSSSIGVPQYEQFLARMPAHLGRVGNLVAFSLCVDGELIATQITAVTEAAVEAMHIAYDPRYARFHPGLILSRYVVAWACERRLPYDFRAGGGDLSRLFGNRSRDAATVDCHLTAWSRAYALARLARNGLRAGLARMRGRRQPDAQAP